MGRRGDSRHRLKTRDETANRPSAPCTNSAYDPSKWHSPLSSVSIGLVFDVDFEGSGMTIADGAVIMVVLAGGGLDGVAMAVGVALEVVSAWPIVGRGGAIEGTSCSTPSMLISSTSNTAGR